MIIMLVEEWATDGDYMIGFDAYKFDTLGQAETWMANHGHSHMNIEIYEATLMRHSPDKVKPSYD